MCWWLFTTNSACCDYVDMTMLLLINITPFFAFLYLGYDWMSKTVGALKFQKKKMKDWPYVTKCALISWISFSLFPSVLWYMVLMFKTCAVTTSYWDKENRPNANARTLWGRTVRTCTFCPTRWNTPHSTKWWACFWKILQWLQSKCILRQLKDI